MSKREEEITVCDHCQKEVRIVTSATMIGGGDPLTG